MPSQIPTERKMSGVMNATFTKTFTADDGNGVAHDYTFNFNANGAFNKCEHCRQSSVLGLYLNQASGNSLDHLHNGT